MQEVDLGGSLKYKIKYDGTEYILGAVTVGEMMELQEIGEDENDSLDKTLEFLEKKGMPVEVSKQMHKDQLERLITLLAGEKKA